MVKGLTITNETKLHAEYTHHRLTITNELLDLTSMSLNNEGNFLPCYHGDGQMEYVQFKIIAKKCFPQSEAIVARVHFDIT